MKKIFTLGMVLAVTTTAANAGWLQKLGFGKSSEPKTLEEACNTEEITAICPDMLLGSQTMMGCLSENVTSLSKKCTKFVKKYVTEHKDEIVAEANNQATAVKEGIAEAKAEKEQQKAEIKAQKQELKNAAAEIKAAAKQTGKELEETGKTLTK
jgi:hypothetical protein